MQYLCQLLFIKYSKIPRETENVYIKLHNDENKSSIHSTEYFDPVIENINF